MVLEYPEQGFLARYNTTFGTNDNTYFKFLGSRGMMDATRWDAPWVLRRGRVRAKPDRIAAGARIPEAENHPSHEELVRVHCAAARRRPAPIDAGFGHAVACIMADEAFIRGRRMVV